MYYNSQTKEIISQDDLKRLLNVSFPQNEEEVNGWHLLHNDLVPKTSYGQSIIPDKIISKDGKWYQTYRVVGEPQEIPEGTTTEDRISAIESGLAEIARMLVEGRM